MPTTPSGAQWQRPPDMSSHRCHAGPIRCGASVLPAYRTVHRMASSEASTSPPIASMRGLPISSRIRSAQSSASRLSWCHQDSRIVRRCRQLDDDHDAWARRALDRIASRRSTGVAGTRPISAPVAGFRAIKTSSRVIVTLVLIVVFPIPRSAQIWVAELAFFTGIAWVAMPYSVPLQLTFPVRHIRIARRRMASITTLPKGNHST